jgi:hypothetical protein
VLFVVVTDRTVVLFNVTFASRGSTVVVEGVVVVGVVGVVVVAGWFVVGTVKRGPPLIRKGIPTLSHDFETLLRAENDGNHGGFG